VKPQGTIKKGRAFWLSDTQIDLLLGLLGPDSAQASSDTEESEKLRVKLLRRKNRV